MRYCVRLRYATAVLLLFAILCVIPVDNVSAKAEIVVIGPPQCTIYVILHKEFHIIKRSTFDREIAELQEKIRIKQKALDVLDSGAVKFGGYIFPEVRAARKYLRDYIQKTLDEAKRRLQDLLDAQAEAFVPPELEQKAQEWKKGIEDTWNAANYIYDCCKVKFIVEIKIRDADDPPTEGFDQIGVVPAAGWRSGIGGGIGGTFDGDGFSDVPYEKDLTGEWSFDDPGSVAAHEAGHEMGLEDQYDDQFKDGKFTGSKTRKGREKDIMGDHITGKPVDKETGIDNINTILRKRGIKCPPECCKKAEAPVPRIIDKSTGIVEDRTRDVEVWNQPERGYTPDKEAGKEKTKDIDKVDEGVQYRNVKEDNTSVDTGIRYERTTDGMNIDVSALATGKGFNFRKWEVTGMKLNIDGEKISAHKSENFYVMRQSVFQGTATAVFAAIGSQYTRYVDKAGSGEVCPVTGKKIESSKERVGGIEGAIDKAGMSAGLGLLTSQAKGEIKGQKSSFTLNKDHLEKISKGKGSIEITVKNEDEHEQKKFIVPLAKF